MNTKLTLATLATVVSVGALFAGDWASPSQPAPQAPRYAESTAALADADVVLYGSLEYKDSWFDNGSTSRKSGVYCFSLDPMTDISAKSETDNTTFATHGGFYVDGYFYYLKGTITSSIFSMTFNKMNVKTWKQEDSSAHYAPSKTVAYDMTYDYTTSTAYAVSPNYTDDKNTLVGYRLRTIDLDNGEFTDVAELSRHYAALSCDATGQLYAIAITDNYPHAASLYKIDKTTGEETLVGPLGLNQKSQNSTAAFDLRTGKLYWSANTFTYNEFYEETYVSNLYEVDLKTGAASIARDFTDSELFSSIFFIDNHPQAPEAVKQLGFEFNHDSFTAGKVAFNTPTLTYSRGSIEGSLDCVVMLDGEEFETIDGVSADGARISSKDMALSEGAHTVEVYCVNADGLKSMIETITVHAGADAPAAVGNIRTTLNDVASEATISWDAPTIGINGGKIDGSQLTYTIRRRPDNVEIATGLTTTTFKDAPDRKMGITQYEIIPAIGDLTGKSGYSELMVIGTAHDVPYLETFDTSTDFMSFITIDANGDGSEAGNLWLYYAANREAVWWMDYSKRTGADDWLITPAIDLKSDMVYRLSFNAHGYSDAQNDQTTFNVYLGKQPTVEAMTQKILSDTYKSTKTTTTIMGLFAPQEGLNRIGIHAVNNDEDHIGLDNIRVVEYGPISIPEAPELTSIAKSAKGTVNFTVKLPSKAVDGTPLTSLKDFYIYGNRNRVAAHVQNPTPGATLSFEDLQPDAGVNLYVILCENESGEGMEEYGTIDLIPSAPKQVVNAQVASTGADAVISWEYPEDMLSATGEVLRPQDIRYNIYRYMDYKNTELAKGVEATTFTDRDAVMVLGGRTQGQITYKIEAETDGGTSYMVNVSGLVGPTLELPFSDSFTGGADLWVTSSASQYGYDPRTATGQDDNYFISLTSTSSKLTSPRLNLSSLINPKLTFWHFVSNETQYNSTELIIGIEKVDANGVTQPIEMVPVSFPTAADESGWVERTVDLSAYTSYTRASVVFMMNRSGSRGYLHLDNISITGEHAQNDMRLKSITGPQRCLAGRDNAYTVTVDNNGLNPAQSFTVEVTAGEEVIATFEGSLEAGDEQSFNFTYTPAINHPEEAKTLSATVVSAESDDNPDNNTKSMEVQVYTPDVPYINSLRAVSTPNYVDLFWDDASEYPHSIKVTDDVESYNDFAIESIGGWTTYDGDGAPTMPGVSSTTDTYTWPNAGAAQAFIVFNPAYVGLQSMATPYSGERCFVSFVSAANNDDWLISPQLLGAKQTITFYARAMHPAYLEEKLEICISSTNTDVEEFNEVVASFTINSATWRQYSVELPAGSRFFAFHCVSADQFGLMIDNIDYVPAQPSVELWGFNVYRDGERIAEEHPENNYRDEDVELERVYNYNVTAVYADGESAFSNTVSTAASGIDAIGADASADADIIIAAAEDGAVVKGANGLNVEVYTIEGMMLYNFRSNGFDHINLQPGLYVIRAGKKAAKIYVK